MPVCKHCQRSSLSKIGTNFNFKYLKRIIHMHPLAFHNTCICMSLLPLICSNHDLLLYCTPTLSHLLKRLAYCLYLTIFFYLCLPPNTFNLLFLTWNRQLSSVFGYKVTSIDRIAVFNSAFWSAPAATSITKPSWRAWFIAEFAEISQGTFCI